MSELVLAFFPAQSSATGNHLHDLIAADADPSLFLGEIKEFIADGQVTVK